MYDQTTLVQLWERSENGLLPELLRHIEMTPGRALAEVFWTTRGCSGSSAGEEELDGYSITCLAEKG